VACEVDRKLTQKVSIYEHNSGEVDEIIEILVSGFEEFLRGDFSNAVMNSSKHIRDAENTL